jgi:ABC-type sulfate transport system permease component
MDMKKLKEKSPHILIVVGAVLILLHSVDAFKRYLFLDQLASIGKALDAYLFQNFFDSILLSFMSSIFGVLLTAIIGLVLGLLLVVYVVKISKMPSRQKYVVVTVLGILGLLFSSGAGGVLAIIAGVIGLRRYPK